MPAITLTFDNGPDPDATPLVLDTLGELGLASTFFVIGEKLARPGRRALAERAKREGHRIGNHTWSHSVPLGHMTGDDVPGREIAQTEAELGDLAEAEPLFRPYGGGGLLGSDLLSPACVDHLLAHRYSCVLWSAVPRDWEDPDGWVKRALGQCGERDWSLVVLHDIRTDAMRRLPEFVARAREAGYEFRTDLPPDLVPIRSGRIEGPIEPYVSDPKVSP